MLPLAEMINKCIHVAELIQLIKANTKLCHCAELDHLTANIDCMKSVLGGLLIY